MKIPGAATGVNASLQMLSGAATQSNYPLDVTVKPKSSTVTRNAAGLYSFSMPAWGVAVLAIT